MPTTSFVTGGSGFIGKALIARLVADGHTVRALARSESSAAAVADRGAEPVRGDLDDVAALREGAAGCEVAYHLAAKVGDGGPWEEFERSTIQGTKNALEACRAAGVRRFVHCGTEAALMDGEPLVGVDETAPLKPDSPAFYPRSKARAEQAVVTANEDGFETVVLRPRFVWGPDDTTLIPPLIETIEQGKFAWIGGGRQLTDTAHIDNVVEGLVLAAERGRPGEAYFVTDGEPSEFRTFVTALLEARGVTPPDRNIPIGVARAVATAADAAWRVLPLPGDPPITRFPVWVSSQECTIDISKARAELGYQPVISRDEGLSALR